MQQSRLECENDKYTIKQLDKSYTINKNLLNNFFQDKIENKGYSISPFFKSETLNRQTTVFRIHLVRGKGGIWKMIKFFPYVNINPSVDITNGMQGALITTREQLFLEQNYPNSYLLIQEKIQYLAKILPLVFQKKYNWRLDGLGVDIGIDQEGNIGIFEVNAGAGVGFMAYSVAKAQVDYYEWLKDVAKPPFNNFFLPIHLR